MSPEERDELIQFILQSQSDAAERHRQMEEQHRQMAKRHRLMEERLDERLDRMAAQQKETQKQSQQNTIQIKALTAATRDLVKVARMHSRRLDRLDGLIT